MRLTGLSETHLTRYLQTGVIRAWKIPEGRQVRGFWRVDLASSQAFIAAKQKGQLDQLLHRNPAYLALQQANTAKIYTLRQQGRLASTSPHPHNRQREQIAAAGLLTTRDLAHRWGRAPGTILSYARNGRGGILLPSRYWGRYRVFEGDDVVEFEEQVGL